MRSLVALLPLALLAAGCIAPPEDDVAPAAAPPPPADRIDGMTATETKQDRKVDCGANPGVCYERDLLVTGRIGLDELPVELHGSNRDVAITAGPGDAWSFHAIVRVRGTTEQEAREGLDTAWRWSHEENGVHALKAGPTPTGPVSLPIPLLPTGSAARVDGARYEVVLPAWVVLDVKAETSNGGIVVTGVKTRSIQADTSNGAVLLQADVTDVDVETSNGAIEAILRPVGSGDLTFDTSNGPVQLALVEDAARGYDVDAETSNGRVTITLSDGEVHQEKSSATFRTRGYEGRSIRSTVAIETSNGPITVTG